MNISSVIKNVSGNQKQTARPQFKEGSAWRTRGTTTGKSPLRSPPGAVAPENRVRLIGIPGIYETAVGRTLNHSV